MKPLLSPREPIGKTSRNVKELSPMCIGVGMKPMVFSEIIVMECPLVGIGIAKLTVGVKKKSGMKIQYCITAIGI